jgi:hypothetical protein
MVVDRYAIAVGQLIDERRVGGIADNPPLGRTLMRAAARTNNRHAAPKSALPKNVWPLKKR